MAMTPMDILKKQCLEMAISTLASHISMNTAWYIKSKDKEGD